MKTNTEETGTTELNLQRKKANPQGHYSVDTKQENLLNTYVDTLSSDEIEECRCTDAENKPQVAIVRQPIVRELRSSQSASMLNPKDRSNLRNSSRSND